MRLALVHEWLISYAGSERVLAAAAECWPDAPIHALVCDRDKLHGTPLAGRDIYTSFLQRLPGSRKRHTRYLPLMPLAVEQLDLRDCDVVLSSSHAVAKGVLTRADQLHVSYVHTPMRYAWDLSLDYLEQSGLSRRRRGMLARLLLHYLRLWDVAAANRADVLLANSRCVARRIERTYRRRAQVIYPPVAVERFRADQPRESFYLVVSRLAPYKRVDLVVEAFTASGRPLVVIGDGPERGRIERLAGANVRLLSGLDDADVADHMQRCRAFVMAADEDFGITAVEAQAAGAPVIAYDRGGARETVRAGETGLFFSRQEVASLNVTVEAFEARREPWDAEAIRRHAEGFATARFQRELVAVVEGAWERLRGRVEKPGDGVCGL